MQWITIDRERCHRDGVCIAVCPRRLLQEGGDGFPEAVARIEERCLQCGHCLGSCPHGALTLRGVAPSDCATVEHDRPLGATVADTLVRGRRSIREFRDEPVPREMLAWLLDATRWAPSASNTQPVSWTVVDGREKVHGLAALVVEWLRERAVTDYADLVVAWDEGRDLILRDAPHLVVAHAPNEGFNPTVDCVIAATNLELAAHALGVGSCWAGFFMGAATMHAPLLEAVDLPEGHRVFAALMLGMPRYRYRRLPPRRAAKVRWL